MGVLCGYVNTMCKLILLPIEACCRARKNLEMDWKVKCGLSGALSSGKVSKKSYLPQMGVFSSPVIVLII